MKRWRLLLSAAAVFLLGADAAQASCHLKELAELRVNMAGPVPLTPVKINGVDATMIVDSGAAFSLVSPASSKEFRLSLIPLPISYRISGVGGDAGMWLGTAKTFAVASGTFSDIPFVVGGSDVRSGAAGVLGENLLGMADTEYDLADGVVRLFRPQDCRGDQVVYWAPPNAYNVVSIDNLDLVQQIIAPVTVNGVRMRAIFDTGAPSSTLSLQAARRAGIDPVASKLKQIGFTGGFGRNMLRTWVAPISSFAIGGEQIQHAQLQVSEFTLQNADMLLGADFFISHHIYLAKNQGKLYFTYNGGPIFNLQPGNQAQAAADAPAGEPKTPDELARRAAALVAMNQYDRAIADYTRAIELAPNQPQYLYGRAVAYMAARRAAPALADLDAVLKLNPADAQARIARARIRLANDKLDGAREDLAAADKALAKESDQRLALAQLFTQADSFPAAVRNYDLWMAAHSEDSRMPLALNGRCWARALGGQQLDQALSDCNAAVRRWPRGSADVLDSRGLVRLRLGDFDHAIQDYDAALAIQPKLAWSLYGRGVAELHKGLKSKGEADLAAAASTDPKVPERAKSLGITP